MTVPLLLLGTGAAAVLVDLPAASVVPVGGLLLWGVREAGCRSTARRVCGHASTLIALTFVLAVSTPVLLPAAVDQLVLAGFAAIALAAVLASSPSARAALRPRRPEPGDLAWLVGGFGTALPVGVAVMPLGARATVLELSAITALVVLVPALYELLYRGLLMHVAGVSRQGVVLVALAQGLATVPLFGWWGLLAGTLLGAAFGYVRVGGGWQASLCAHWGVAFGLAAPVLMGAGVIA
ncbi:hypothetical protein [Nocardioides gansuensis]|nr:hypothetical protein [Nocardioides gansuensis]